MDLGSIRKEVNKAVKFYEQFSDLQEKLDEIMSLLVDEERCRHELELLRSQCAHEAAELQGHRDRHLQELKARSEQMESKHSELMESFSAQESRAREMIAELRQAADAEGREHLAKRAAYEADLKALATEKEQLQAQVDSLRAQINRAAGAFK